MNSQIRLLVVGLALLLSLVAYKTYQKYSTLNSINSYESCISSEETYIVHDVYPPTCVTKLGASFTKIIPSPTPYIPSTADWIVYNNQIWRISFKYPPTWKIKEIGQEIRIYPDGYIPGTYFTLINTTQSFDSILAEKSRILQCNFDSSSTNERGEYQNIKTQYAYSECGEGAPHGFYYLYVNTSNIVIEHSFNDSGSFDSVGAILFTFHFTD